MSTKESNRPFSGNQEVLRLLQTNRGVGGFPHPGVTPNGDPVERRKRPGVGGRSSGEISLKRMPKKVSDSAKHPKSSPAEDNCLGKRGGKG